MGKYREVQINGDTYPISFGMAALADFTESAGLQLSDLSHLQEKLTLKASLQLVHAGLKHGGRIAKKPYEGTLDDTCDLMDAEEDALAKVLGVFSGSLPVAEEKKARAKPAGAKA